MEIGVDKEQVDRDSDKDRCGHRAIVDRDSDRDRCGYRAIVDSG